MPRVSVTPGPDGLGSHSVEAKILSRISSGDVQSGDRLGSERELAAEFNVTRSTVRQALQSLEQAALIRRVPGRGGGTFVTGSKIERDLSRVVGVPELLRQQGFTAGSRIVGTGIVSADAATATALGLRAGELVVEIARIRLADGEPMSLDHARFPASRFPGLLELPLGGSLYELFEEHYGIEAVEAVECIEAEAAQENEAAILGVPAGSPLISVTRTAADQKGVPFEYSHDLLRADRVRIVVRTPSSLISRVAKGSSH